MFNYIKCKPTLPSCDLKTVSHRLAILICLTTGQRDQTIQCLNLNYVIILNEEVILFVPGKLKETRPGHHLPLIENHVYSSRQLHVQS